MSVLSKPYFHDEDAAFEHLERTLWPEGPVCPHCGTINRATRLQGDKHRRGVWKCNERECRKQFTVKVGTVFEHGRMPLHKMIQAIHLMCSSKKGISAHQLHRTLEITYKSAWFLAHRIREAMRNGKLGPLGGGMKHVEADETFFGNRPGFPKQRGYGHKMAVMSLVERGGDVRSVHVESVTRSTVEQIIAENVAPDSRLSTDTAAYYRRGKLSVAEHGMVNHFIDEYVRGDVHVNTLEGFFSIFKRGMKGVYQHCSEKHLHRYLAEFDFRYNARAALGVNDETRSGNAIKGIVGKRLTYRAADHRRA